MICTGQLHCIRRAQEATHTPGFAFNTGQYLCVLFMLVLAGKTAAQVKSSIYTNTFARNAQSKARRLLNNRGICCEVQQSVPQ